MAIPATLLSGLAKAATDKAVQAAAVKLAQDVYGRIITARKEEPAPGAADPLGEMRPALAMLATKEELAASFAMLQAELDRRHRRTIGALVTIGVLQMVAILLLVFGR